MSWGNNNRRRGGGGNFTPKPRPTLPKEHELQPLAELACKHENKALLRDYGTRGDEVSKETIILDGDPKRRPIPVPVAAMFNTMQFGVPMDHPEFPPILKFNTLGESNAYYARYQSPIMWIHNSQETDFRHIPGFTRYVVDKHRRILNAHNGMEVKPLSKYMIELVPDGPSNKLVKTSIDQIMNLAYTSLPEDFIDFGFRTYSHDFGLDIEGGQVAWVAKGKVKVKNNDVGMVAEYSNLPMFMKTSIPPKEFQIMQEINQQAWKGFNGGVISAGPYSIRESTPFVQPPEIPRVGQTESAPQQDSFDTAPQEQPQQQSQPQEQPAPQTEDISFDDIEF